MTPETFVKRIRVFTLLKREVANKIKGGTKQTPKISRKYQDMLQQVETLDITATTDSGTAWNSFQYYLNSLDWEIKSLINKGKIKSLVSNDAELTITLVSNYRITAKLCGAVILGKDTQYKHRYCIYDSKRNTVLDVTKVPALNEPLN